MCDACGKSFGSKEYLKHHLNIHTGSKPFKCDTCERSFAQRNSLSQHLKIHTGERPYKCTVCGKQFTQINALQRHQRIHTGEKPFMCVLCKRAFTDQSTFRRHTLVHDVEAPWKTYLVMVEGNIEEKKPRSSTEENAEPGKKISESPSSASTAPAVSAPAVSTPATSSAHGAGTTQTETTVVPTESVTLPSDWTSHGAIALVSHGALGDITVIHTEVPAGTQFQPIIGTNNTGMSVISLDGSAIPVPFSLPVSVTQPVSLSSEACSTSLSLPTLSVPVSDTLLTSVSGISTSSVLEAAVSQAHLASDLENKSNSATDPLLPDIQTVVVDNKTTGKELDVDKSDGQHQTADDPLHEQKTAQLK
ncbi:GDNF-inducible zinc finger protein 1 [Nematolebias whitei]|uniref:GDNF-inducible zinc finger protein 1 n=1 Tax=Nematolebias whitei TaxID=451745 RepID=UPI00189C3065|nr:GDNF-inducible zinc finger protein 1 [Nematolebias whitei]